VGSSPIERCRPGADLKNRAYGGAVPAPEPEVHAVTDIGADGVPRITDAGTSLSEEQRSRTIRYAVAMSIRTVCFIGAVLAPSPWRWVLVAGAIVLPYFAVVMANAGRERRDDEGFSVVSIRSRRRELDR
jgi:hypothetical protein